MAKHSDHLSFRDAVRASDDRHEQERLLADEEQYHEVLHQDDSSPSNSLPVYMTIHR